MARAPLGLGVLDEHAADGPPDPLPDLGPSPHDLPPEAAIVQKILEIREDLRDARRNPRATTVKGVLHRLESELLARLHEIRAAGPPPPDPHADLTDAELLAEIVAAIPGLTDADLDAIEAAIARRRSNRQGPGAPADA